MSTYVFNIGVCVVDGQQYKGEACQNAKKSALLKNELESSTNAHVYIDKNGVLTVSSNRISSIEDNNEDISYQIQYENGDFTSSDLNDVSSIKQTVKNVINDIENSSTVNEYANATSHFDNNNDIVQANVKIIGEKKSNDRLIEGFASIHQPKILKIQKFTTYSKWNVWEYTHPSRGIAMSGETVVFEHGKGEIYTKEFSRDSVHNFDYADNLAFQFHQNTMSRYSYGDDIDSVPVELDNRIKTNCCLLALCKPNEYKL